MSWGAVAAAGASVVGGAMQGQQNAAAQGAANENNVAIENARQKTNVELANAAAQNQAAMANARLGQDWQQFSDTSRMQNEASQSIRDYAGTNLGSYNQAGQQATQQMSALLGLGTPQEQAAAQSAIQESPGQKFIRERAQKSLLANQAAIGGLGGGNVRSALVEQGTGFAAQDLQNQFSRLQALSGQGLSAGQAMVGKDRGVYKTGAGAAKPAITAALAGANTAQYTQPAQKPGIGGKMAEYDPGGMLLGGVDNTFGTDLRGSVADPVATVGNIFSGGK